MGRPWTKQENEILKKHFPKDKKKNVLTVLPKRTWNAINCRAAVLGNLTRSVKRINWTKKEKEIIKKHWSEGGKKYILNLLQGRTWNSIMSKASDFKIKRTFNIIPWSQDEDAKLRKYWPTYERAALLKLFPDKSFGQIKRRANDLSIRKLNSQPRQMGLKLSNLLKNTPEAYYWIGFIMADGCIMHDKKSLTMGLGLNDFKHLRKFSKFVDCNLNLGRNFCQVAIKNIKVVSKLIKKFDFKPRKTYHPPVGLKIINNDLFVAFMIGLIDGDGSFDKNKNTLQLEMHLSWKKCLNKWFKRLWDLSECEILNKNLKIPTAKSNKRKNGKTYARIRTANYKFVMFLNDGGLELKLPRLERKWNTIKKKYSYEQFLINRQNIINMLNKGLTPKVIGDKLGFDKKYIYHIKHISKDKI